jgi:hypothetical protein
MRYLGNNLETTGFRVYRKGKGSSRTRTLISWSIGRCCDCGRFTNNNHNRCKTCDEKHHNSYPEVRKRFLNAKSRN